MSLYPQVAREATNDTTERKRYPSDLTDEKWAIIEPLLPINTGPGPPVETDLRAVIDAILYRVRTAVNVN